MNLQNLDEPRVLSFAFNTRGFGYALFEGINEPVDWGTKAKKKTSFYEEARVLIHLFEPSVVVLPDAGSTHAWPAKGIKRQIKLIAAFAERREIEVLHYTRRDIRRHFAHYGAKNKDEIAREIGKLMPEFAPRIPPMRKPWQGEHRRMTLFDSLALMVTYYATERLNFES